MATPTRYTPEIIKELYQSGEWLAVSLSDVWANNAARYPDREAVVDSQSRCTWKQATLAIDRLALGFLKLGFQKDEVLVIQLSNCAELPLLRVAGEKAGVLCLPVLRNLRHREVENILARVRAKGIVIPLQFRDFDYLAMVRELQPRLPDLKQVMVVGKETPAGTISINEMVNSPIENDYPVGFLRNKSYRPEDVSLINHTTGTTGFPKFVEYPMAARLRLGRGFVETLKLSENDIICSLGSVPAGANTVVYFGAPLAASKVVMLEHFEAETAFRVIEKEKVTIACGVPAMWSMMVNHPERKAYDLSSIRLWWNAGAFLPYQLAVEVEEKLGSTILSGLGAADFGGTMIPELTDSQEIRFLTVGKGKAGTVFKIVDDNGKEVTPGEVGEIWGTGPSGASGYYMDSETTWQTWTRDGWFKTGDLGRLDEEGNLILAGRKKDIIIRGGQNLYPSEIESLLGAHPSVAQVAIVGMPDKVMGEKACAYVVPHSNKGFGFGEMVSYLKSQDIALYKIPERLEIVDKLPMVGGGIKIDKKALQQDIAAKLKKEVVL